MREKLFNQLKRSPYIQKIPYLSIILAFAPVVAVIFILLYIDNDLLHHTIAQSGMWAPAVFIFLKILTIVAAPLSGGVLYISAGALFGFWKGLLYILIGDLLGYTISFFISRFLGKKIIERFFRKKSTILSRIMHNVGTAKGFGIACLMFFWIPELLSYTAGFSKLSYWKFILIITTVLTPGSVCIVYFSTFL